MQHTLPHQTMTDVVELLNDFKNGYETQLEASGWCMEIGDTVHKATPDLIEETGYGKTLKALAVIYEDEDWRTMLPSIIHENTSTEAEAPCHVD